MPNLLPTNPLLEAARQYAVHGWQVLPLHTHTHGQCSCGASPCGRDNKNAGKHPRHAEWTQHASAEMAVIERWWQDWPASNVGILCGHGSHLAVLDIDPRNGGDVALEQLIAAHGALPETPLVLTGGGGRHYYFLLEEALPSIHTAYGVDLQCEGTQVVAPPSLHLSGNAYLWEASSDPCEMACAPLPAWLADLAREKQEAAVGGIALSETLPRIELTSLKLSARIKYLIRTGEDPDNATQYPSRSEAVFAVMQACLKAGLSTDTLAAILLDTRFAISTRIWEQKNPRSPMYQEATRTYVAKEIARAMAKMAPPKADRAVPDMAQPPPSTNDRASPATALRPRRTTPYGDVFNAELLHDTYGENLRYCAPWKTWLLWTGTHWAQDEAETVMEWARQAVREGGQDAFRADDEKRITHLAKSLNHSKLTAMVAQARSLPGIPILPQALDAFPWLLNCANGVLDLRTGVLAPPTRDTYLTRCLAIPYASDAAAPTWLAFLWRIMGGTITPDTEDETAAVLETKSEQDARAHRLIGFLQRAVGYALSGDMAEECLFLLHGSGRNGKSKFLSTLQTMLGPYAKSADMRSFLMQDRDTVRNDLADLFGTRLVCAVEIQEGKRFAEGLIKQLTGRDRIKARFLFKEYFEFLPEFTIFLAFNHKPVIGGTDGALWSRLRLIPFEVTIPPDEQDKHLGDKLCAELPGILAWAVRGCLAWQREGLNPPPEVLSATEAYQHESDTIAQFIEEACLVTDKVRCKASDLYTAYGEWCKSQGLLPGTHTHFGRTLSEKGYQKHSGKGNVQWRLGITLSSQSQD